MTDNKKTRKTKKHEVPNDYNLISRDEPPTEYYCSYCNYLLKVRISNEEFWCNRCSVSLFLDREQLKKKTKLVVPERNKEPSIYSIASGWEDFKRQHGPELKGSFLELSKKVRIKDYREDLPK